MTLSLLTPSKTFLYSSKGSERSQQQEPRNVTTQLSSDSSTQICADSYQTPNSPAKIRREDTRLAGHRVGNTVAVIFSGGIFQISNDFLVSHRGWGKLAPAVPWTVALG